MADAGRPPEGALTIDYRGTRYLLGRTRDAYALWSAEGGAPIQTWPVTFDGWAEAWRTYVGLEGPNAKGTMTPSGAPAPTTSPTATWRRGQPLEMQPMRVGQILDGAGRLYRMHFRTLIPLVALITIPFQAVVLALQLATLETRRVEQPFTGVTVEQTLPAEWVGLVAGAIQFFLITPFLTAAVTRTAADAYLGHEASVGRSYRAALPKVHSILWVSILVAFAIGLLFVPTIGTFVLGMFTAFEGEDPGGLMLLALLLGLATAVPAIFLALRWLFATSVVVVEDGRGTKAMRRSWNLMRGLTAKALGTMLLTILFIFAVLLIAGLVLGLLLLPTLSNLEAGGSPGAGFYALNHAFNALIGALTTPFMTLVIVLLYFDARIRKEGFDLQVMAEQIAPAGA